MKRISFYAGRNRSGNLLHVETDGCIVNIQPGLTDLDGRRVTSVRVSPDSYAEAGGRWVLDGSRVVQLRDGETELPRTAVTAPDPDGLTPDEVETLAVTAAELWDPEDAGADEALSQRQREVLARVHALYSTQVNGTW